MNLDKYLEPEISIIINCYNGERYLEETLKSALNQTYKNFEIIFWDNQSSDASAKIVKSFSDNRIKYFYAPSHTPLGVARNLAVEKAQGEWIAFLDCDDLWMGTKIEKQMKAYLFSPYKEEVGLVYSRTKWFKDKGASGDYTHEEFQTPNLLPQGNVLNTLLFYDRIIALSSAIIKKKAFLEIGGIPTHFIQAEDLYVFCKISAKYQVIAIDEFLTYYRLHSNNLTFFQRTTSFDETILIIDSFIPNPNKEVDGLNFRIRRRYLDTMAAIMMIRYDKRIFSGFSRLLRGRSFFYALSIVFKRILSNF